MRAQRVHIRRRQMSRSRRHIRVQLQQMSDGFRWRNGQFVDVTRHDMMTFGNFYPA